MITRRAVAAYGLSLAALGAAVLLRWLLDPLLGDTLPLVTLFGAVAAAVWSGGYRPAVVVVVLGYFACAYLFIEPRGAFRASEPRNLVGLLAYLVTCSIIIGFGEARRVSQRRFEELARHRDPSSPPTSLTIESIRRKHSLRDVAAVGFALTLVVLVVGVVLGSVNLRRLSQNELQVARSNDVIGELEDLRSTLTDAEAGQRGYLLSDDEKYLRPYVEASARVEDTVARLKQLEPDDPDQQGRLARLQLKIALKLGEMERTISLSKAGNRSTVIAIVRGDEGKALMDDIRQGIAGMRRAEEARLRHRAEESAASFRAATLSILVPSVLGILLLGLVFYLNRRNLAVRQLAAEMLTEQRERLRVIIASATDAIICIDADQKIMLFNAAAEAVFGYSADEMVGHGLDRLVPARFREHHRRYVDEFGVTSVSGRAMGGERVLAGLRRNGEEFPMEARISQVLTGRQKIYTVILRDVTGRKRAEAERDELLASEQRAREQAEAATRAKDAFLAIVSHELRTPLSPILTWARMLRQGTLTRENVVRGLEVIDRCARSQAQLIEDLLDVSRIVAGKMRLEVRPVMVASVIEKAVEIVRPAAEAKNVRLQMVLDTEVGAVSGDAERLQQVVWNLLSNAVKFTPKGGCVQVALERVNSHVEIAVSDTGQGIEPEFLPYVFDRFQQADLGTSRAYGGLGLGLAIVRHIVEAHGGTVHAESPGVNRGAVFTVKLPLMIARTAGETERRHPTAPLAGDGGHLQRLDGLRILIVDDEPDSTEAVGHVLASCGAEVRTATSAEDARAVLGGWKADMLVSDIGMPGEDGYALISSLRAGHGDVAQIPAVALTAYASREDKVRLLSAGFQAHIAKPLDAPELVAVLASLGRAAGKF